MIATIDHLLALGQKLLEAERMSEREPIYVALDLNEVRLLQRMIGDYFAEVDSALSRGALGYASDGLADETY